MINIPAYKWVPSESRGCDGCAFRKMHSVPCSLIPCRRHPNEVAVLIDEEKK